MSTLSLKRRRDIWRQKWQFVAVLVTVVLGVAMFTGTFNAYLNLGASLDGTYDRLHMADVTVADPADDFAATAASIDGIETVVERNQAEPGQGVRGVIVAREISNDLKLACSYLPDVELFEYELSVLLRRVEV